MSGNDPKNTPNTEPLTDPVTGEPYQPVPNHDYEDPTPREDKDKKDTKKESESEKK
jgi:hypothetical protein